MRPKPPARRTRRSQTLIVLAVALVHGLFQAPPVHTKEELNWESLAPMPTPRTEASAAVLDGEIYLIGGYAPPAESVPIVEIYNPEEDAWRPGPPLPLPVNHAAAATLNGEIYVLGGYIGYALGSQFSAVAAPTDRAYVLRNGAWESIARLPEARAAGSAAVVDHRIFVIGGVLEDGTNATDTFVYDPHRDRWNTRPGLRYPRQHLGVTTARGDVYAVGGRYDLLNSNVSVVERFDPVTRNWSDGAPMPTARGGLGVATAKNGLIVAIGGESPGGTNPEAEAYSPAADRWSSLPPMPTPRHGLGVVAVGNIVYAIGGGTQPGYSYSSANEAIDLSLLRPK